MGSDMVGYLVVGPNGPIGKTARKQAVAELKRLVKTKKFAISCASCGHIFRDNDYEGGRCFDCGTPLPDVELAIACPQDYVKALADQWPPEFRDVANRAMPGNPKQMLVFAGDMTWGDEPEGGGYQYLQELLGSGLSEALGVL